MGNVWKVHNRERFPPRFHAATRSQRRRSDCVSALFAGAVSCAQTYTALDLAASAAPRSDKFSSGVLKEVSRLRLWITG